MTKEFVTLPREVVEQVLEALIYCEAPDSSSEEQRFQAAIALRAALDQPQNHVSDAGNMVPAGWKLVPVEPTRGMLDAAHKDLVRDAEIDVMLKGIHSAMLAAAPQPPTVKESLKVQPQQGELEPVAWYDGNKFYGSKAAASMNMVNMSVLSPVYLHPQPKREPLTVEAVLGVAKSIEIQFDSERLNEQIDDILVFARAIEHAHHIK